MNGFELCQFNRHVCAQKAWMINGQVSKPTYLIYQSRFKYEYYFNLSFPKKKKSFKTFLTFYKMTFSVSHF